MEGPGVGSGRPHQPDAQAKIILNPWSLPMTTEAGRVPQEEPLAYFLTWTTYGTWLPGDERGWVEKSGQFREPAPQRQQAARQRMTEPALTLDVEQRR